MLSKQTEVLLAWSGIYLVEYIDHIFWMFSETPERNADKSLGWLERMPKIWRWDHNERTHDHPRGRAAATADQAVAAFLELHKLIKEDK